MNASVTIFLSPAVREVVVQIFTATFPVAARGKQTTPTKWIFIIYFICIRRDYWEHGIEANYVEYIQYNNNNY